MFAMHMYYVDTGKRVTRFNLTVKMNILKYHSYWLVCVCVCVRLRVRVCLHSHLGQ